MEKKTKFVVWNDDFFGNGGRTILGHVNTFAEGQELLVKRWKKNGEILDDYEKNIEEVLSHTEEEMVGRDELTLYKSNCYFHEGIARVPGYIEEDAKVAKSVTLGEVLKQELCDVGDRKWKMNIANKSDEFYLQIEGQNKVPIGCKYDNIVGLPTHHISDYCVYSEMSDMNFSEKSFPGINWANMSVQEIDNVLGDVWLARKHFFSEEEAFNSLPQEIVIYKLGKHSFCVEKYNKHGYHIENISADDEGVYVHIKKTL